MAEQQRESSSTPSSVAGSDPFSSPLSTTTSGRATTTERRTTTTTTTKRTIKSSDDFMPTATDIQQVRSESRTGSISSTSTPLTSTANQQTSTTTTETSTGGIRQPTMTSAAQAQKNWSSSTQTQTTTTSSGAESLQSPVIQDTEDGHRILKLRFDVAQYEPDEIVVKTIDNRLTVHAKHEERSENRSVYREYNREFHLPDGCDIEQIKSSLSKDGILTVDCPLPQPQLHGASRRIPIDRV